MQFLAPDAGLGGLEGGVGGRGGGGGGVGLVGHHLKQKYDFMRSYNISTICLRNTKPPYWSRSKRHVSCSTLMTLIFVAYAQFCSVFVGNAQ